MFFEDLGHAYNAVDDYLIFDTFNLTVFQLQIDALTNIINNVKDQLIFHPDPHVANAPELTTLNATFRKMLELNYRLRTQFNSIVLPPIERKRTKRGLFNFIGKINKFVTGVMDSDDEEKFTQQIESIRNNQQQFKDVSLTNVKLMSNTLKEVKIKTQQFNQLQDHFKKTLNQLLVSVEYTEISTAFQLFLAQYDLIYSNLVTIQETILVAPLEINPALITPAQIYRELANITLPRGRMFPLQLNDENFNIFLHSCTIVTKIKFNTIVFIISIPILEDKTYIYYHLHPIPIHTLNPKFFTFIRDTKPFLITDIQTSKYVTFDFNEKCKPLHVRYYLCYFHKFSRLNTACEMQLYTHTNSTACSYTTLPVNFEIWTRLQTDQWIFAQSTPSIVNVTSHGHTMTTVLPQQGMLTIPFQTTIASRTHIFEGHDIYNTTALHVIGNFTLTPSIFNITITDSLNISFPMINFDTLTIDHLEQQWNNEKRKVEQINLYDYQQTFLHSLSAFQIVLLTLVLIVIIYLIYRCRRSSSGGKVQISVNAPTVQPPEQAQFIQLTTPSDNPAFLNSDETDDALHLDTNSSNPAVHYIRRHIRRTGFSKLKSPFAI